MPKVFLATYCGYRNASQELSFSLLRSRELFRSLGNEAGFEVVIWDEERVCNELSQGDELVRDFTEDFFEDCQNEQIRINPEWLKAGLFRWKPAIICHMLEHYLEDSDVLVYLDCNLEKFPRYREFISSGPCFFLRLLGKKSVVVFQDRFRRLGLDVKGIVLQSYLDDFRRHGAMLPGLWAGCIVFKKVNAALLVARSWLDLCTVENLAPVPDVPKFQRLKQFKWHSQEQSMLSVLYHALRYQRKAGDVRLVVAPARRPMLWRSPSSIYQGLRLKLLMRLCLLSNRV